MSSSNDIHGQYRGTRGELFPLAVTVALLTLVTLGIYRFWGKTRIRKYIWSSTVGDGDAFEYTGTGLEKFLGFLVAVTVSLWDRSGQVRVAGALEELRG